MRRARCVQIRHHARPDRPGCRPANGSSIRLLLLLCPGDGFVENRVAENVGLPDGVDGVDGVGVAGDEVPCVVAEVICVARQQGDGEFFAAVRSGSESVRELVTRRQVDVREVEAERRDGEVSDPQCGLLAASTLDAAGRGRSRCTAMRRSWPRGRRGTGLRERSRSLMRRRGTSGGTVRRPCRTAHRPQGRLAFPLALRLSREGLRCQKT